jgi:5-methyltetrahydropteroyltriglutamate--homocysteine methyltransferase
MKQSVDRILTTHVGSLSRPRDLLDLMKARLAGLAYSADGIFDANLTVIGPALVITELDPVQPEPGRARED